MPTSIPEQEQVQQDCWTRAIHAFGTAAVFERRAARYRRLVRVPAFLGVAVPVVVGGMVLSFGTEQASLPAIILVAGILGLVQLVMSVWALVAQWESTLAYALESASENHRFATEFEKLAKDPTTDLRVRFEMLDSTYQARGHADVRQVVSQAEKRFGLRSGLHRFQRACVACKLIPDPEDPTGCSVCGK